MNKLTVTQNNIDTALAFTPNDHPLEQTCPIAQALRQVYPTATRIRVHPDFLFVEHHPAFVERFRTTMVLLHYMKQYDRHRKATPRTFQLIPY